MELELFWPYYSSGVVDIARMLYMELELFWPYYSSGVVRKFLGSSKISCNLQRTCL